MGYGSRSSALNREEFVVGWSDQGSRHRIGALRLAYYTADDKLIYAGRVGIDMAVAELERLYGRLQPLAMPKMPLSEPPPRGGRFGSLPVLSRVHWVRPEMVEVSYVEWTQDGLLRHVVYLGERGDKPGRDVIRSRSTYCCWVSEYRVPAVGIYCFRVRRLHRAAVVGRELKWPRAQ